MFSTIRSIALGVNEAIKSLTGGEFNAVQATLIAFFGVKLLSILDTVITRVLSLKGHLGGIAGGLGGGLLGVVGGGLGLAAASAVNPFSGGKEGEGGGGIGSMVGSLVFDAVAMALGGKLVGGLGRKLLPGVLGRAGAGAVAAEAGAVGAGAGGVLGGTAAGGGSVAANAVETLAGAAVPGLLARLAPVVATGIAGLFASPVSSPDRARSP